MLPCTNFTELCCINFVYNVCVYTCESVCMNVCVYECMYPCAMVIHGNQRTWNVSLHPPFCLTLGLIVICSHICLVSWRRIVICYYMLG